MERLIISQFLLQGIWNKKRLMKTLLIILLFTGIAFSQITKEEQIKILLAEYAIQLDETIKLNMSLTKSINALVTELQAIKEPSDELIAILKKYNIYKGDNGNIPSEN